jgi:predicted protein tyrosine phosphatase
MRIDKMTNRLREVIRNLYRQPTGPTRQVFALSRHDAERLPSLPSVAVISITAPERLPANLSSFDHLLRLSFADVDFLGPNLSRKAQEKARHAFTVEQARMIRSFVDGLPPEIASIVVHCEGGYSRSCAVAFGLHKLYGYTVDMNLLSQANPSVVRILTDESAEGDGH